MANMQVKKNRGRQKVAMVKMAKDSNRQVTFSKRRTGLFKKASELCTMCGADVAIIVFSPGGKPFSFGHPAVDPIINRYMNEKSNQPMVAVEAEAAATLQSGVVNELNFQLTLINTEFEMEKKRSVELNNLKKAMNDHQHRWMMWMEGDQKNHDDHDYAVLQRLEFVKACLEELRNNVEDMAKKLMIEYANIVGNNHSMMAMDPSSSTSVVASPMVAFDGGNNIVPLNGDELGFEQMEF